MAKPPTTTADYRDHISSWPKFKALVAESYEKKSCQEEIEASTCTCVSGQQW